MSRWLLLIIVAALPARAAEPWVDARMPVTQGLVVWLDASKLTAARKAAKLAPLKDGDSVDVWPDGSGGQRQVAQKLAGAWPTWRPTIGFPTVRFENGSHLRLSSASPPLKDLTVFVVAAPYSTPEFFSAALSMSAAGKNDFETGMNIDHGNSGPARLEVLNIEGAGSKGLKNLLKEPMPYGSVVRLGMTSTPGKDGTVLTVNGKRHGARDREDNSLIHMDEFIVGARHYTLGGKPEVRNGFHGDIAEVLVYDRVLADADHSAVEKYLAAKYDAVAPVAVPSGIGTVLERVNDAPPIQMFAPGFTVRELPVDLTNINNVKYRDDGTLVALGYDGRVWLLRDTDGDGIEDKATLFSENKSGLKATIGMDLTPPGYQHGDGIFTVGKTRCVLIVDTDKDDKADREIVVADGWKEGVLQVDGLGVAFDPRDGSIYFGRGTPNYVDPYQRDRTGLSHYSRNNEGGSILRVSADFKEREIVATGIRIPVAIRHNGHGDLFCTDQEGATWVPNGNPLDELLHIQKGRHYGFPPRHPKHLPDVVDEPSTIDYGPQHQSTCGFCFNEPVKKSGPIFGPKSWAGDAIVTGESRGKLYRTQLVKTTAGYVARTQLLAALRMLTLDCCVAPDGSLVVACHSGGPDWGSGPAGKGKLYKITYTDKNHPQPVLAWPAGPREVRVEFDRPVDPLLLRDVLAQTTMTAGPFVRAGDRFETIWPGYAVVQAQHMAPRLDVRIHSAQLTPDRRTLVLATDPLRAAVHHAITLPGMGRPAKEMTPKGALPQHAKIDLDFDLSGYAAVWKSADGKSSWSGWLPHVDLAAAKAFTAGSAHHDALWKAIETPGSLTLKAQLNLTDMLRPAVQPGSKLNYELPAEKVTVTFTGAGKSLTVEPKRGETVPAELSLSTPQTQLSASFSTAEDKRPRPLQLHRALLPWADTKADLGKPVTIPRPKELDGGSWARGRKVFFSEQAACFKCHSLHGQGGEIGPDLSNLIHRDYASVMRDITQPSFAINPDYVASAVRLTDGRTLSGVVRTKFGKLNLGDKDGRITIIDKAEVAEMNPSPLSVMPDDLLKALGADQSRDLLTFLLTSAPSMPRDYAGGPRPKARTIEDVTKVLAGSPVPAEKTRQIRVVLVAGPKDHAAGEHDYPAWLKAWSELLLIGEKIEVATAMGWPAAEEFRKADVIVFYQRGEWDAKRAADIDAFLERGGGLVYIHWAVDGQKDAPGFAKRIGLASGLGSKFRHGPLELDFEKHPITRNIDKLKLVDESYWDLIGDLPKSRTLGRGVEEKKPRPLFWTLEPGQGRVFVSIPGHYSWTFDDPLFRVLLLRGIAWTAREPVDRFNDLVWPGADIVK